MEMNGRNNRKGTKRAKRELLQLLGMTAEEGKSFSCRAYVRELEQQEKVCPSRTCGVVLTNTQDLADKHEQELQKLQAHLGLDQGQSDPIQVQSSTYPCLVHC